MSHNTAIYLLYNMKETLSYWLLPSFWFLLFFTIFTGVDFAFITSHLPIIIKESN